jgi:hypothetical protein
MWPHMQNYRYKAKFVGDTSSGNFFDTTTWIIYGPFIVFFICFVIEGVLNFDNNIELDIFPYPKIPSLPLICLSPFLLFVFKLIAQHFKFVGLLFFIFNLCIVILSVSLCIYWWVMEQFYIVFLGVSLYYGFMSLLTFNEYKAFDKAAT